MKKGGIGGGNTTTGLRFEGKVDFMTLIEQVPGYSAKPEYGVIDNSKAGTDIYFEGKAVATCFKKHQFYKFLEQEGVDWENIISKKLLPDDAILVILREMLFIIEVKYQEVAGSVDEKLQTCDFKRKQYVKLVSEIGLKVEYVYVLNDWFKHPSYRDVLDYIHSVNCHYRFNELPLEWLGLPTRKNMQSH